MQSRARTASVPESGAAPMLGGDGRYRLTFGFSCCPGVRGEFLILFFFVLAALVLTWPMVATLGQATGTRGDYLDNLWNGWWLKHSLVQGHSPFWTDYLYFPDGISLRRHTLSPLNAPTLYWGSQSTVPVESLLLGRVTYQGFSDAWPPRDGEFADKMNAMPKHVASTTLRELTWNATLLEGDVPSPIKPPPGCHFHGRCRYAEPRCRVEVPAMRQVAPGHTVACHLREGQPVA